LAHRGILFLDEFPEFTRQVLENLRQPLEDGVITVSRAQGTITFPARFTLIAAQNPCPCGYYSDPERRCICAPTQIIKYQKRISGPLLDRIDLHIEVPRIKFEKLTAETAGESSEEIRARVEIARARQTERFQNLSIKTNAEMGAKEMKEFCKVDEQTLLLLKNAVQQLNLSARAYHRVLKTARTIADLCGSENIVLAHVAEALQYRTKIE
jgi:magnesium chelatase family protein